MSTKTKTTTEQVKRSKDAEKQAEKKNVANNNRFSIKLTFNDKELHYRQFNIARFDYKVLQDENFFYTMRDCANFIKEDLVSKSRIFETYLTHQPVKITGFADRSETEYITTDEVYNNEVARMTNKGKVLPEGSHFKFTIQMDNRNIYEELIDARPFQHYVCNNLDITNPRGSNQKNTEQFFGVAINHYLQVGKEDVSHKIIRHLCQASNDYNDERSA